MERYTNSTASKQSHRFPDNYPKRVSKAKGAYLYDEDGNKYLDFTCALGAISLGYCYPEVDDAVCKTLKDEGNIFSLSHKKEWELADLFCQLLPSAEMVRFAHNGKDVTEAAIRLARHVTGRETVLSFSYHGASDVFMACTKANNGVPGCLKETIIDFDYNNFQNIERLFKEKDIAAVILEPHTIRYPMPWGSGNFLDFLRDITEQHKSLLIFDEIVSFPRYLGYSAARYFNIYPDLICISKGMANGYPISALTGKEKYMKHFCDNGVFFSTTFGGNLVGVSAALATINEFIAKDVTLKLNELGSLFKVELNEKVKNVGLNCRQFLECDDNDRQKIWQEMIKKGYFLNVPIFFNYSMKPEEIIEFSKQLNKVVKSLDSIKLEGKAVKEVFKKR